jgi:Dyp-type peroxidase family
VWGADAILQVAADTAGVVDASVTAASGAMAPFATVMRVERGARIGYGGPNGPPAEHFGFLDGLSNPVFLKGNSNVVPHPQFDPASPELVLFPDPFLPAGEGYASYLACLKLAQNVTAFQAAAQKLAAAAGISADHAKAWMIGRRADGSPLLPGSAAAGTPYLRNDFDYSQDPAGQTCPFASHVRKMNLRPSRGGLRIVRRGVPYGPAYQAGEPAGVERGLLFLSYQRWFNSVLGHMIEQWAAMPSFPLPHHPGVDPVLSSGGASHWPAANGTVSLDLARFVEFAGGDLFLIPSPGFLRSF